MGGEDNRRRGNEEQRQQPSGTRVAFFHGFVRDANENSGIQPSPELMGMVHENLNLWRRAKLEHDYATANELEEELLGVGVVMNARARTYQLEPIRTPLEAAALRHGYAREPRDETASLLSESQELQMHRLLTEKRRARRDHDWPKAEVLTKQLRDLGVTVTDATRTYRIRPPSRPIAPSTTASPSVTPPTPSGALISHGLPVPQARGSCLPSPPAPSLPSPAPSPPMPASLASVASLWDDSGLAPFFVDRRTAEMTLGPGMPIESVERGLVAQLGLAEGVVHQGVAVHDDPSRKGDASRLPQSLGAGDFHGFVRDGVNRLNGVELPATEEVQVHELLTVWRKAKRSHDFSTANEVEDELLGMGVLLNAKARTFRLEPCRTPLEATALRHGYIRDSRDSGVVHFTEAQELQMHSVLWEKRKAQRRFVHSRPFVHSSPGPMEVWLGIGWAWG